MTSPPDRAAESPMVPVAILGLMTFTCLLSGYLLTVVAAAPGATMAIALAWLSWLTALAAGVWLVLVVYWQRTVSRVWWIVLVVGMMVALNGALILTAVPKS